MLEAEPQADPEREDERDGHAERGQLDGRPAQAAVVDLPPGHEEQHREPDVRDDADRPVDVNPAQHRRADQDAGHDLEHDRGHAQTASGGSRKWRGEGHQADDPEPGEAHDLVLSTALPPLIRPGAQPRSASSRRSQTSLIDGKQGTACHSRSTGAWPVTATVAEWSSSATPGNAPSTWLRSTSTARTRCPARSARSAERPTAAASGSQKKTCGTAWKSAVAAYAPQGAVSSGRPAARAATAAPAMRAWYLPWWVSRAWWSTSPIAYSQQSSMARTRQVSSTSSQDPGVMPTVSRPMSSVSGVVPMANSTSSASSSLPSSRVTGPVPSERFTAVTVTPMRTSTSASASARATNCSTKGSIRGSRPSPRTRRSRRCPGPGKHWPSRYRRRRCQRWQAARALCWRT